MAATSSTSEHTTVRPAASSRPVRWPDTVLLPEAIGPITTTRRISGGLTSVLAAQPSQSRRGSVGPPLTLRASGRDRIGWHPPRLTVFYPLPTSRLGVPRGRHDGIERVCDGAQVVDVSVGGVEAEAHRDQGNMRATRLLPRVDLCREPAYTPARKHHVISAEVVDRPAQTLDAIAQPFPSSDGVVDAAAEEDEAVREAGGPVERLVTRATE